MARGSQSVFVLNNTRIGEERERDKERRNERKEKNISGVDK